MYSFAKGESALDISGLTKLKKLDFAWNCPIRDKDLASMGELRQLKRLRINSWKTITGSGMAYLASLTSLNSLLLYGNLDLTDDGLLCLPGMKRSPAMNPWKQNPDPFFNSKSQFLEVVFDKKLQS